MAKQSDEYRMPEVFLGEVVIFHRDGNPLDPVPAIVQGIGEQSVDLGLFVKDSYECFPIPHVRHKSDPQLLRPENDATHYWEYGPTRRLLARLQAQFDELVGRPKTTQKPNPERSP